MVNHRKQGNGHLFASLALVIRHQTLMDGTVEDVEIVVVCHAAEIGALGTVRLFTYLGGQPFQLANQPFVVVGVFMLARGAGHDTYGACVVFHACLALHGHGLGEGGESVVAMAGEMLNGADGGLP